MRAGAAAAPDPGTLAIHPRRFGFNSPGRRTRTAQPSQARPDSTVGANSLLSGSRVGWGRPLASPCAGGGGDLRPLSPGAGTSCTGAGITCPRGRVAARAPSWAGARPRKFGVWETDAKPLRLPGGRRFRQKKTWVSLFQACENFADHHARVAGSKARL